MKSDRRRQFETVFLLATMMVLLAVGVATYLIDARSRQDRERIELISELVQHTGTAVCVVDAETQEIIHWNMAAEHLLGWSWADVYGEDAEMLVPDSMIDRHRKGISEAKHGLVVRMTCPTLTKGDDLIDLQISIRDATVGGKHYWVVQMDRPDNVRELPPIEAGDLSPGDQARLGP